MRLTPFTPDTVVEISYTERRTFVATLQELAEARGLDMDGVVAMFNEGLGQEWLNENSPESVSDHKIVRVDAGWDFSPRWRSGRSE